MTAVVGLFALFGLLVFSCVWSGFALTLLWGWFVVPTFALPPLTLAQAIGLAIVIGYLTHQYKYKKDGSEGVELLEMTGYVLMRPAVAIAIGWIVKQWM